MKVYLASRFDSQQLMRDWRTLLIDSGFEVTSRWLDYAHGDLPRDEASRIEEGTKDLEDIQDADVLILHSPAEYHGTGKGGRHTELGYCLGLSKPAFLVGEPENVFQYLILRGKTLGDAIAWMQSL